VCGITDRGETRLRELLVNADPSDDLGWLDELTRITQEQLVPAVPKPVVTATGGTHP
jgi:hypothetical protein